MLLKRRPDFGLWNSTILCKLRVNKQHHFSLCLGIYIIEKHAGGQIRNERRAADQQV